MVWLDFLDGVSSFSKMFVEKILFHPYVQLVKKIRTKMDIRLKDNNNLI